VATNHHMVVNQHSTGDCPPRGALDAWVAGTGAGVAAFPPGALAPRWPLRGWSTLVRAEVAA